MQIMDEFTENNFFDLYGLNQTFLSPAFQFPRLPPGLIHPLNRNHRNPLKKNIENNNTSHNEKLFDFKDMYQKFASGLFDMSYQGMIPPGHPFFSRQNSIEILQSENSKLQRDNLELKKQIEKLVAEKSKS